MGQQLTADQAIGNYWIRANPSEGPEGFVGGINSVRVFSSMAGPVSVTFRNRLFFIMMMLPMPSPPGQVKLWERHFRSRI